MCTFVYKNQNKHVNYYIVLKYYTRSLENTIVDNNRDNRESYIEDDYTRTPHVMYYKRVNCTRQRHTGIAGRQRHTGIAGWEH